VAEWLRQAGRKFNQVAAAMTETDQISRWHPASILGAAAVIALLYAPHPPEKFRPEFDPKSFPVAAVQRMHLDPAARIFTYDQWGDYLIWRLYPAGKVFVDGRSDFYGDDFENQYIDVMNVRHDWEKTLGGFGVDTILLPPSAALSGVLRESSRWRVVYDDGVALVFRTQHRSPFPESRDILFRMKHESDPLVVDHQFFGALVAGSLESLDELLAEDFILIDVLSGSEISKAALLATAGSGQIRFEGIQPLEARVRRYGATAVITGRTRMNGKFQGSPFEANSRYTHVYVEQQGRWRLVSAQGTQIAAGQESS